MSEYIVDLTDENHNKLMAECDGIHEDVVRCRDCTFAYRVFWPESCDVPEEFLNCHGPLVAHWDYEQDEPAKNPFEPDGFCAWGERRER